MLLSFSLVIAGFVLLIFGAGWLVDGASALAKKFNVSDLAVGLTVVAFGTSAPELVVNCIASNDGHSSIVLGNIIGSNLFNLFAILGIAGMITPIVVQHSTIWKEIPISLFALLLLFVFANESFFKGSASINRIEGIVLLVFFCLFLLYVIKQPKTDQPTTDPGIKEKSAPIIIALIAAGLAGLIYGGKLVVDNAIVLATAWGMSQKVIGLTIIAAGTSLPELVTSVVAAVKKKSDIAMGNVIGSNIFNIFLVLGVSSLIDPIQYESNFNYDIYLLAIGTLMLFGGMFIGKKNHLDRWQAFMLFMIFGGYTTMLIMN